MRLKQLRKQLGISQSELAKRAGITGAAISKLEKGGVDPVLSTVIALSGALGVDIDILVGARAYPVSEEWVRIELAQLKHKLIQISDLIKQP
jgi:transcriptional regulator with XRE-family HTH domain